MSCNLWSLDIISFTFHHGHFWFLYDGPRRSLSKNLWNFHAHCLRFFGTCEPRTYLPKQQQSFIESQVALLEKICLLVFGYPRSHLFWAVDNPFQQDRPCKLSQGISGWEWQSNLVLDSADLVHFCHRCSFLSHVVPYIIYKLRFRVHITLKTWEQTWYLRSHFILRANVT